VSEKLVSAVGQSLLAIGLYTVAFESMVLSFRGRMFDYLNAKDPASVKAFLKACGTADNTFKFCTPRLLNVGVIEQTDVDALSEMRKRRNAFAHEGYNEMMNLLVADVESDVQLMYRITRKIERWKESRKPPAGIGERISLSISPAIFGLYLQVATEIACLKLPLEPEDAGP
jgi:hypothetical protein